MVCVRRLVAAVSSSAVLALAAPAHAQGDPPPHDHSQMTMPMDSGWTFQQDGILFVVLNRQGSDRGGTELVAPNWWMGMASREIALTVGGVRDLVDWRGFVGGVGADVTVYGVPDALQPTYGAHPLSFHLFLRLRPPAGAMGRMWNMRMSQPMAGHDTSMPMSHKMP